MFRNEQIVAYYLLNFVKICVNARFAGALSNKVSCTVKRV